MLRRLAGRVWRAPGNLRRRISWSLEKRSIRRRLAVLPAVAPADEHRGAILFFSPEAGIEPHFVSQCVLARTLRERGHRVLFVRCRQDYFRCPVMDSIELPYDAGPDAKREVCLACMGISMDMLGRYGLPAVDLSLLLSAADRARVEEAIAGAPRDLREMTFDGIAIGRLCAHDLVLATKVSDFDAVPPEKRDAWLQYVRTALLSYLASANACRSIAPRALVHYNDYSLMLGARLAAERAGVPSWSVTLAPHRYGDRSRYVVLPKSWSGLVQNREDRWPDWRGLALAPGQVQDVVEDLFVRLGARGAHTYSPQKTRSDVRERLGIPDGRRLLVAYTSSLDERLASRMSKEALGVPIRVQEPFADQITWLRALAAQVASRSDRFLVVRVHPREGVNRRDKVVSQHLLRLREAFQGELPGVRFVWPEEPVSSYDLAEAADVALVSWSTIGMEMARMGVPVVASTLGIGGFPADDFIEFGATPEAYFERMEAALSRDASTGTIARAFRWYHLYHLGSSIDLGDVDSRSGYRGLPPWHPPKEGAAIERIIVGGVDPLEINRERLSASQSPDAAGVEVEAVRLAMRRLVHFLMTGEVAPGDPGGRLEAHGDRVTWHHAGGTAVRRSRLAARLAPLIAPSDAPTR